MLRVFRCVECRKRIQTDLDVGDEITCPYCEAEFTLRASHEDRGHAFREFIAKIAIPIGYILFVGIPLSLAIGAAWYFTREKPNDQAAADPKAIVLEVEKENEKEKEKENENEKPLVRPQKKKEPKPNPGTGLPEPEPDPEPMTKEPIIKPQPKPPVEVAAAPPPREVPAIEVAPPPREARWEPALSDFKTEWQTVGAVDLRIHGIAITKVPYLDPKGVEKETPKEALVIAVEGRLNAANKNRKRAMRPWAYGRDRYSVGFLANGSDAAHVFLPPGSKFHTGLPDEQPMLADGTFVHDFLIYELPPAGAGELLLRLDCSRCGENVDATFKIPETAWKK